MRLNESTVEEAAPAVKEHRRVAVALEDARDGLDVIGEVALDDAIAGQWREGGEHPFHAADGAVAAGVDIGEEQALLGRHFVHLGGQGVLAPQATPELRAEALLQE